MARAPRLAPAGYVYHVINRGFLKTEMFADEHDYACFLNLIAISQTKYDMRVCSYCLMPNHWHLALWPKQDKILSSFMQKLTSSHVIAWRNRWGTEGHLYQGRFKSFPVQNEQYYYRLLRYIESNPLRAGLATHSLEWKWSSAWLRQQQTISEKLPLLSNALPLHDKWLEDLATPLASEELKQVRTSVQRSRPFGDDSWAKSASSRLILGSKQSRRGSKSQRKIGTGA